MQAIPSRNLKNDWIHSEKVELNLYRVSEKEVEINRLKVLLNEMTQHNSRL